MRILGGCWKVGAEWDVAGREVGPDVSDVQLILLEYLDGESCVSD